MKIWQVAPLQQRLFLCEALATSLRAASFEIFSQWPGAFHLLRRCFYRSWWIAVSAAPANK